MPRTYPEDQLVERPASGCSRSLCGPPSNAGVVGEPRDAGLFGRETKGEVVSIDKATALKMRDKVRNHWSAERARVDRELAEFARYPVGADVRRIRAPKRRGMGPSYPKMEGGTLAGTKQSLLKSYSNARSG